MSDTTATARTERLSPENVAKLCERVFGMPVVKVTAPGGKSRESLRVHFASRSIVATQRKYPGRRKMEVEVLKRLSAAGCPVPKYLGGAGGIFFQDDVGSRRLSGVLAVSDPAGRQRLAAGAIDSLLRIQDAGQRAGLDEIVPALGTKRDWVMGFLGTAITSSEDWGVAPPAIDAEALADLLHVEPRQFLKWDARPGNASVGGDGVVYWFDWEHCGKRQGMEDIAWLAGDEFWPLGAQPVIDILQDRLPPDRAEGDIRYLTHFMVFHIVQRLNLIRNRVRKAGWADPHKAMRLDKIGSDRDLARRLCRHGAEWAERQDLTRPMVPWFRAVAEKLDTLRKRGDKRKAEG